MTRVPSPTEGERASSDVAVSDAPPAPAGDTSPIPPILRRRSIRRGGWLLARIGLVFVLFVVAGVSHRALDVMVGSPLRGVLLTDDGDAGAITDPTFRGAVEALIQRPLAPGNRFELLTSGQQTYPRLWEDLRGATRSITLQMYYCNRGSIADSLRSILTERARAGVAVRLLPDGFGCRALDGKYREELEEAGVEVAIFRPIRWYTLHRAQHRSHVRAIVVDGRIGYTGGMGIDEKWFDPLRPATEWRETNVRMTGPAVAHLQAAFAAGWAEATGDLLAGADFFPPPAADGPHTGAVLYTTAGIGSSVAERFLSLSIAGARRTLFITNSYFVPDADFRRMLRAAARRGVDVRILTAGPRTDVRTTLFAGRANYEELLAAGVRIYEFELAMMHAKSLVVDGTWLSVGTMNFDNRSLRLNEESNLVAFDAGLGSALDSLFHSQLHSAREIRLAEFQRRSWWARVQEWGAGLLWFVL